ncbi:MAG: hypothetical protein P4L91_09515 [Burkholderiaceae bacterium]|nr:hypothetical protein [Burkholderiaceae bacterium]
MNYIQHWGYWSVEFFLIHLALEHPVSSSWMQTVILLTLLAAGFVYARYAGGWMTDRYNNFPEKFRIGLIRMGMGLALCLPALFIWGIARFFV